MAQIYSGRMVTDGEGHVYAQPEGDNAPLHDEEGNLLPDLVEVRYDPEVGNYIIVEDGRSHNEVNDNPNVPNSIINGTTGPLYDNQGMLVVEGDPHHDFPLADDPHADGMLLEPDEVSHVSTGHTAAYEGKHGS